MKNLFYIVAILIVTGCGSSKGVVNNESNEDLTTIRLINEYYENTLDFKTLDARTRLQYRDDKRSQTVTVSMRIEKDKKIWLNASLLGITGARALITPESVQFYDKLNRQYFDGDFEFLSQYLGVDIDFLQLQRLLTGQAVYDLRDGKYNFEQTQTGYNVTPRKKLSGIELLFSISAQNFMVDKQRVAQPKDSVSLDVLYSDYQTVGGKPFPTAIAINANDNGDLTNVEIEFKNIDLDKEIRFPFSIPSGYKELDLNAR